MAETIKKEKIVVTDKGAAFASIKENLKKRLGEDFGPDGKQPLVYHSPEHSMMVAREARGFLEVVRDSDPTLVAEDDLDYAEIVGLCHDIIQNATTHDDDARTRHRGFEVGDIVDSLKKIGVTKGNERASADELLEEFERYYNSSGNQIFPIAEANFKKNIEDAVAATYPNFQFLATLPRDSIFVKDIEKQEMPDLAPYAVGLKISQPHLTPESSLIALAVATADLRADVGRSNHPEQFFEAGNHELLESNPTLLKDVHGEIEKLTPTRRAEIAKIILNWIKTQVSFALWQKELFLESLNQNKAIATSIRSEEIKNALIDRYGYFDQNILAAQERYESLENMYGSLTDQAEREKKLNAMSIEVLKLLLESIGVSEKLNAQKKKVVKEKPWMKYFK